ncbi:hypothetical protein GJ697_26720 [Pseudoduganella sp. FT25W]|uniref:Putative Flp pilus-assembly TadG-like N-terminal domain-containing protein n=2 Tax=Duganella alba TaxID=2666081 RepID=A0A6L5QNI9_9BURK|nr:pilus assembly protein TadG-related protein [Duganella alba]MRX11423.1 hypothetical protein [Duganella alba]MRX19588.1 hypothetical protein [Duganella alba]
MSRPSAPFKPYQPPVRQRGQALVYGLFMLIFGLASLFFMFNTGQLTAEKTKLVNTADAVAYSAAVMHARALNFDAYTNRALVANEMTIAQMVSLKSWLDYAKNHTTSITPLYCNSYTNVPAALLLDHYTPLCMALAYIGPAVYVNAADTVATPIMQGTVIASEVAKIALQAAQVTMFATFVQARSQVMQEVADANYVNDGTVKVDTIPLTDNYLLFDGQPFISPYTGNDRKRMADLETKAVGNEKFLSDRGWSDSSLIKCSLLTPIPSGNASHTFSTQLNGLDSWEATDRARITTERWKKGSGIFSIPKCRSDVSYGLGSGAKAARTHPFGNDWQYSGVPSFFELSSKALAYGPGNSDPDKKEARLQFAIRLTRAKAEQRTSAGTSDIRPAGRLAIFSGDQAKDVMAAVATSEVFFDRMDGVKELGSLFNPYWHAHLVGNSAAVTAAATALQEP